MTRLLIPLVPRPGSGEADALHDGAARPGGPVDAARDGSVGTSARADLSIVGPSLAPWATAVTQAHDLSLLLDPRGAVAALSAPAAELLGLAASDLLGRDLLLGAHFVDFRPVARPLDGSATGFAPLQALRQDAPARGLVRIRRGDGDEMVTCDAVATPLHNAQQRLVGVLVMLCRVIR